MAAMVRQVVFVVLLLVRSAHSAQEAKGTYSMALGSDCTWIGKMDMPRDKNTLLNGIAPIGSRNQVATCRLQFGPQTPGDTLKVSLLPSSFIDNCDTSLTITMSPGGHMYELGCKSVGNNPTFEERDGEATIMFKRPNIGVSNYYFQVSITASRSVDKEPPGGGSSSSDVGMIVGIVAGLVVFVIVLCLVCICCWRRRRESLHEKRQFINGGAAGVEGVTVAGTQNGVYTEAVRAESPGSNRRLLNRRDGGSEDGGNSSVDGKARSALDRFGPPPSRRRQQQVAPHDEEGGRRRDAFQTESEVDERRPQPQARGFRRGSPAQDYEDVGEDQGRGRANRSPPGSPLLSDLRSNPKFRRSFHENEMDADKRARRVSDHTSSGESQDSREQSGSPGASRRPHLPRVPRSPSRSPSPQRRGEKIAAIYRSRPSSSVDAARLDSDRSEDTPPIEERDSRDTRHVLRPNRDARGQPVRGRSRGDDDIDDDEDDRRRHQRRRDREDEERQRRRHQEEEEEREEEERRRKQEKKRRDEERRRREEEEEREEEERRRKQEKKKKEEERRRREEEEEREEERRRRRAAKESDGSEYEGRFKKSASGRKSKGKGPRMGRSRSTGNALEELEERHQRSRSKSPGSAHSLNFIEDDETDLDSNYLPFRRAGSKTSLYASRSSLYGRRRKNSLGETVSVSSRTALDDADSRMGDFDRSRMSQTELHRLFKSTGELEMRPESAHVVREVGTSTNRGGSATVYGRKTQAKGRHGKRYSRGTQTPRSGRDRRDSVGSAKSGRSTSSRHKLKSSRSRESLGGRRSRSRSRGLTDDDEEASDDSSDNRSKKSGRSGRSGRSGHSSHQKRKKSHRSNERLRSDSEDDNIADDQSVAPSSIAPSSMYGAPAAPIHPAYGQFPAPMMAAAPGYPQMVYQPVVAPGGPPAANGAPPGVVYQMAAPAAGGLQKPPIAPKPKPNPKPGPGSRWDELVNLTDGMKQRRRQMGESVTEDGTESILSSMWSQPTYNNYNHAQQQPQPRAPPSYTAAQKLAGPADLSYSSAYPDSSGAALTPPRNARMASYSPSESNV